MAQVVIAGAGPAGATLALLLVQRGISVQLVEASRTFNRLFRGEGLMPSGLEALAQMGLSTLLKRIPHRPLDAWEFLINQRLLFRVDEPLETGEQPCTLVSQPALLAALIEAAQAYPQFEFLPGLSVQDLVWQGQRVAGVVLSNGRQLASDVVIGTDGRNSLLRQRADLPLAQQSHRFDILWFRLADHPRFASSNVFYSILQGRDAFGLFRSSEDHLQVGWAWHGDESMDWKQLNWSEKLADASPAWLAEHFRQAADTLERPVLLSVMVGQCPHWSVPGLLLLGDAAHPMSPIRAQGINMALRDVIVAANALIPRLQAGAEPSAIDAVLPTIQAAREPEINQVQQLQSQEFAQAELLGSYPYLQVALNQFSPLLRQPIRQLWVRRQRQLRQGVTSIQLRV